RLWLRWRRTPANQAQPQREAAAMPWLADQTQLALQQARQLTRDRQAQPCAAMGPFGLTKGLENQPLLERLDTRAGIRHGKAQVVVAVALEGEDHVAVLGEFAG